MDKKEAIQLLKWYLNEIPRLARLHHANIEYPVWHSRVADILKEAFGRDSGEYQKFTSSRSAPSFDASSTQSLYRFLLRKHYADIQSAIQRHDLLGIEETPVTPAKLSPQAFISHGKEGAALKKLEEFLRTLGIEPLIIKEQPSPDKAGDNKVNDYLGQADFVVVLATGDEKVEGKLYPKQNVIHEVALAQKTHPGKIIYLLEEGTEPPPNTSPEVWGRFKQRDMAKVFSHIVKELKAFGILRVVKLKTEGV